MKFLSSINFNKAMLWTSVVIIGVLLAGMGFVFKLIEFSRTISDPTVGNFALMPVTVYLACALGFAFLLVWNFLKGGFRNIEEQKFDIFELDKQITDLDKNYYQKH